MLTSRADQLKTTEKEDCVMKRTLAFLYGGVSYLIFFGAFLYAVGFVGNLFAPKTIDSGARVPFGEALLVNALLLGIFAVQHSGMARQGFKQWWTRLIPAPVERSTYVLISSLVLILLFWQWRPMLTEIWRVENPTGRLALEALFIIGWLLVLVGTFLISHFDLFGLRQVWLYLQQREYHAPAFVQPFLYKYLRHPIMLGFIIAFWATPVMTSGHLLFAIATTAYILIAIQLEERDLVRMHGDAYREYQQQVSMLIPLPGKKAPDSHPPLTHKNA
jgi:protein-S-isoprenylcysteine O-methyltransferase Ste14